MDGSGPSTFRDSAKRTLRASSTARGSHRRRDSGRDAADPPTLHTAVPNWQAGETIPLGADRMLRVVETRFVDDEPVLIVEHG